MSARDDLLLALRSIEQMSCEDWCSGEQSFTTQDADDDPCHAEDGTEVADKCPGRMKTARDRETRIVNALTDYIGTRDQEIEEAVRQARQEFGRTPFNLMSSTHAETLSSAVVCDVSQGGSRSESSS